MDYLLSSNDQLTKLLRAEGITTWNEALHYSKQIPYGRNTNREDFSLVVKENKGTCSSKHAFLKEIANQNQIPNVDLVIGIYKMDENNTKIGSILSENKLNYLPEAHCYLKILGETVDVTSSHVAFEKIKNAIVQEIIIEPYQVADYKVAVHKDYLKKWRLENEIPFTFEELWSIRERCIEHLSNESI